MLLCFYIVFSWSFGGGVLVWLKSEDNRCKSFELMSWYLFGEHVGGHVSGT